jgi:hypothetical protein
MRPLDRAAFALPALLGVAMAGMFYAIASRFN